MGGGLGGSTGERLKEYRGAINKGRGGRRWGREKNQLIPTGFKVLFVKGESERYDGKERSRLQHGVWVLVRGSTRGRGKKKLQNNDEGGYVMRNRLVRGKKSSKHWEWSSVRKLRRGLGEEERSLGNPHC